MASNSGRKSGSSGRSNPRKRVVIGADETVRVRYRHNKPEVESERRGRSRTAGARRPTPAAKAGERLSTAKRQERERRQRWSQVRRIAIAVGVGLLVLGGITLLIALYRAPIFPVKDVVISAGPHHDRASILALAKLPADATLPRLNARAVVRRLTADPWIADATVERDYPSTVRIKVSERRPAVVVDGGGTQLWVASSDGRWLGLRSAEDTSAILVRDVTGVKGKAGASIGDPRVLNAIKVVAGISPELRRQLQFVSAPTVDETALHTRDDVEIFVGSAAKLAQKDRIVRAILKREKNRVVYVNVRVVERPTWRGLEDEP